jgi:hypothetical protein
LPQGATVSQPTWRFSLLRTKAGAAATQNIFSLGAEKIVTGQIDGRSLATEAQKSAQQNNKLKT